MVKLARAAVKASGDQLAKEVARDQKEKMARASPKATARSKPGVKKAVLCKPFVRMVGRPVNESGACNQCRWLLSGKKGGKPHTCGKLPYVRL